MFQLIGQALKTQEIAPQMHLSPKTVETYRDRIQDETEPEQRHRADPPGRAVGGREPLNGAGASKGTTETQRHREDKKR